MRTRSETIRLGKLSLWLVLGMTLAIGALVSGSAPTAAQVPNPRIEARPEEDAVEGWDWPDGAVAVLTIDNDDDPGNGTLYETSDTVYIPDWDPGTTYVRFDFRGAVDLLPGHYVTLSGGGDTKVHQVTNLGPLDVDPVADTVSGLADAGSEVWTWIHGLGGSESPVTADASGYWSRDFSGMYDLTPGTAGPAVQYDDDGDVTWIEWSVPNPTIAAEPDDDRVQGWQWPLGATVTLSIYDPSTPDPVDYSDSTEVVVAHWDPEQTHFNFELWDVYDIQPNHEVTISDGTITKFHIVTDLAETGIDYDADTVSGTAAPGTNVSVWYCDEHGCVNRDVVVNGSGEWTADFQAPGDQPHEQDILDIVPGMELEAAQHDEDGDSTQIRIYGQFLQVRVNQSHNWVNGNTTPGSTIVATVWRDGLPIMADRTDNGSGSHWHINFPGGDEYRLQIGDVVEVETSRDLSTMVDLLPIQASVDAEADSVSGQIFGVPFPANVRVEVWQQDGPSVDAETDGTGNFTADFDGFDVLPGHMVFIAYVQPDGNQVGIIRHALRLYVDTASDSVSGETIPDTLVSVRINGETGEATSDVEGRFSEIAFAGDIKTGDTVDAWAGDQHASLVVEPVTAYVDEDEDKVFGYGPPSSGDTGNINVGVNHDWGWTSTDNSGYYEVYFDYDIAPSDWLQVEYGYPEGHTARYGFGDSDVGVNKWASIYNVSPGDEFTYFIGFHNNWSGTATNVQITDTLPEHATYVPHPGDLGPAYDAGTHTLTWDIGTLGGGRNKEIELHLLLEDNPDLLGGRLSNYVEISADNDRDPGNNSSRSDADIRPPGADFWVNKERASGQAIPGGVITYRVRFGNRGNRPGEEAVLTDLLPANTTFEGSTYEDCEEILIEAVGTGQVDWILDTLPASGDEGCEFEFSLRIDELTTPGSFLTNELRISEDTDPWADNRDNRRLHNTVVEEPAADLWVDKVIEGDFSNMGNEILYRIDFRNDGNTAAQDVSLTDTLPPELSRVWHSAGSAVTGADGTVTWDLGTVPPGAGGELLIGVRLDSSIPEGTVMTNIIEGITSTPEMDTSNNVAAVELGPPRAIAVPWVGDDPHRVWSGLETTLKGIAKGYGLTHYEWDFGDGSPVISGSIDDPYAIEARHIYVGNPGDTFVATLTVWGAFGWSHSDSYHVGIFNRIHGVEKDVAIDEGLWYQHKSAERYRSGGLPFAEWQRWCCNIVAVNATAIQAFQIHGHLPGGDPLEDPYVEDVRAGWNALLTYAVLDPMSVQPAGDPDSNGNTVGIGMYQDYGHSIYESGMAMMALASTGTPDRVARTGPVPYVRGRTYDDIVQDMADWFAWGQNDADPGGDSDWARGGWRYQPNSGDSDNSNTQFPVLGLAAAEDNWGITVPQFVKDELRIYWLAYSQNDEGGFGYSDPWGIPNVGKTGAGIMDLVWAGVPAEDGRVVAAAQYIEDHWDDPPDPENYVSNVGDLYAMYAVKKGSQLAGIVNYGPYYWDLEYTTYLIEVQQPDGRFDEDPTQGFWFGDWQPTSTSWALLILSEGLYEALPVAIIAPYQYNGATEWYVGDVQFDGTLSHHTNPDLDISQFDWDFGDGETATDAGPTPYHTYVCQGEYPVTLTVTDNDDEPKSDSDTLLLTVQDPWSNVGPIDAPATPVAIGDQPIIVSADFYDAYPVGPHTAVWDWGDGSQCYTDSDPECSLTVSNGEGTVTGDHTYLEPGVYEITLTVTDGDCVVGTSTYEYVVVYDPDGGFVTGGGWIYSEPGNYIPDPTLEGKANFGFVSKYKKGKIVPSVDTEFQFHAADLNFHSSDYDWLVITGSDYAKFKGSGTINGEGDYKFKIWAGDGTGTDGEDTFRIKIWVEDKAETVIYDNGVDQEIAGGSIVVHSKKK